MDQDQDYSMNLCGSFAEWDPLSSCWKTYQRSLFKIEGLDQFLENWPTRGLMFNGKAYRRPIVEHRTKDRAGLAWPTPVKTDFKGAAQKGQRRGSLVEALEPGTNLKINPTWIETLMGFPQGWTCLNS